MDLLSLSQSLSKEKIILLLLTPTNLSFSYFSTDIKLSLTAKLKNKLKFLREILTPLSSSFAILKTKS